MKVTLKVRFHAKQHNNGRSGQGGQGCRSLSRSDFMLNNTIMGGQGWSGISC